MKKITTLVLLLTAGLLHAQAFKGDGDVKLDIGATIQNGGSGIRVATDFGLGENMSFGFAASYLLSVSKDNLGNKPDFGDRIDVRGRFNANLGNVFELDSDYLNQLENLPSKPIFGIISWYEGKGNILVS